MSAAFRGPACKWAELVDGELLGGIIRGAWDLGHPDPENPTGGPEHRACNRGAPSRLAAKAGGRRDALEDRGDGVGCRGAGVQHRLGMNLWGRQIPGLRSCSPMLLLRRKSSLTILRVSVICLSCLLDDHPELGAALDLARRYGAAELDLDGRWIAAPFDD